MESRRRAGEGTAGWGATRRRRRPPNFPPTVFLEGVQAPGLQLPPRLLGRGTTAATQTPGHTASRPRGSSAGGRAARGGLAHPRGPPRRAPPPRRPGTPSPLHLGTPNLQDTCPLGARAGPRAGPAGESTAEPPAPPLPLEFPTFSPDPDAAGADRTSRALPSPLPPASWSHAPGWWLPRKSRVPRRVRTPEGGRREGRGGSGGAAAAAAAGEN